MGKRFDERNNRNDGMKKKKKKNRKKKKKKKRRRRRRRKSFHPSYHQMTQRNQRGGKGKGKKTARQ